MSTYKNSLISCVVPVYNVEKYLSLCLDSILSQVYKSFEIILVDDGSTDDSGIICDEYKLKHDNIVVIHQKNGGVSDARNKGIQAAKGEFITFIDSDDVVHPQFFNDTLNNLMELQADISITQTPAFSEEIDNVFDNQYNKKEKSSGEIVLLSPSLAMEEMFSGTIEMTVWGKLYKTELFKEIQFPKDKLFEDWATIYKVFGKARTIVSSSNRHYGYRIRVGSITQSPFHPSLLVILQICDEISDFLQKHYPECLKAFAYRRAQASMMLMERIIAGKPSAEQYIMLKRLKHNVRADLTNVLLNGKVRFYHKLRASVASYSIFMYKFAYRIFLKIYR